MAEQPSLGGAIALQGRNRIAEDLGTLQYQAAQKQAAAGNKLFLEAKKVADKQQEQISDLFMQSGNLHPKVLKDVDNLLNETMTKITEAKSSDNPFATNKYAQIERDVRGRMMELKSFSNQLNQFDNQVKYLNTKTKYYGDALEPFMETYRRANTLEDLKKFAASNPNAMDYNLRLDPNGIPELVEQTAIPFEQELQNRAKSLGDVVQYKNMVSVPGVKGAKELQTMWGRPLYIKDAEQAMKDNPGMYKTRPRSLEDEADAYLSMYGDDLIAQMSTKYNMGIRPTAQGYTPEDRQRVKDNMILLMARYANPELKDKIVVEKGGFNISVGAPGKASPDAISKEYENLNLQTPKGAIDEVAATEAQRRIPRNLSSYARMEVGVGKAYVQASDDVRDQFGNRLTGNVVDATITSIRLHPYKIVKGSNGQDVKILARADEASKIEGVAPFVQFSTTGGVYYTPLVKYANKNVFAGDKYDASTWDPIFRDFFATEAKINKGLQGKTWKNQSEFDKLVLPLLK
jgi:hypothetical protein